MQHIEEVEVRHERTMTVLLLPTPNVEPRSGRLGLGRGSPATDDDGPRKFIRAEDDAGRGRLSGGLGEGVHGVACRFRGASVEEEG